jgi:hypothetical protein
MKMVGMNGVKVTVILPFLGGSIVMNVQIKGI